MNKQLRLSYMVILITIITLLFGCKESPVVFKTIDALNISDSFNYRTTEDLFVNYEFGSNFSSIPVSLYASVYAEPEENQAIEDLLVGYGITDSEGTLELDVSFPIGFPYLVMKPGYIGLPYEIREPKPTSKSKAVNTRYISRGEPLAYTFKTLPKRDLDDRIKQSDDYWWFINDTYLNNGKPASTVNLTIEDALLKDINNSVFAYNREKRSDQDFLDSLEVGILEIEEDADVWLTFIHENAGFSNTFGYYTYNTNEGPPSDIPQEDITIVFPNASYQKGSRGALQSGDSVYMGNIKGGTSIGFVIISNGWFSGTGNNPIGKVREEGYQGLYYSEHMLNPETNHDDNMHSAIIYHEREDIFLIGMEDNKHTSYSYNFNDVVFAVVVDDVNSVKNLTNIPSIKSDVDNDSDGDGVLDSIDAYPHDVSRTTTETLMGTLAFEDLWPKKGDYDFNDLVISYTYDIDGNASNEIVSVNLSYKLVASGAGFPNGLALSLPLNIDEYEISDYTYSNSTEKTKPIVEQYNGTRGSQILIFKTQNDVMKYDSKPNPFNTGDNLELEPQSVEFSITFSAPVSRKLLGSVPYDVFILIDNAESDTKPEKSHREVHLTNFPPTPLANTNFFNTEQDTTDVNRERYYRSAKNLPWAIHIPGEWEYPLERKTITDGYNYFGMWAESEGSQYQDWYQAKPNYKNTQNLYK